jgi:hypothetical protein
MGGTMKRFLTVLAAVVLVGCATSTPRPAKILSCKNPKGKEYTCSSNQECSDYFSGYSAVLGMKGASPDDPKWYGLGEGNKHPVVHMNLYNKKNDLRLVGRIEAELRDHPEGGKRWYVKLWTIVCDCNGAIVTEDYSEGFREEADEHEGI